MTAQVVARRCSSILPVRTFNDYYMFNLDKFIADRPEYNTKLFLDIHDNKFEKQMKKIIILLLTTILLTSCTEDMPANIANTFAGLLAIWGEVILAILAMFTGIGMIAVGCWLTYAGYTGDYQLFIKGGSIEASLVNATPGVLLIVLGVIVIIYRAKINIKLRK